jgi:DNA-binding NarL/FixJ family response regulator
MHTFTPGWDYEAGVRCVGEVAHDLVMELTRGPDDSVSSRLLICNDDPLAAEGIARIGEAVLNVERSIVRPTISELIEFVQSPSDLIVTDVFVGGKRIDHQVRELGAASRVARIVVVASVDTDANRLAAARAGASGYCDRDAGAEAISQVLARAGSGQHLPPQIDDDAQLGRSLTPRENDVLRLLDRGLQVKEVALELTIAQSTVRWYVRSIFEKLDVHSTTAASSSARARRQAGPPAKPDPSFSRGGDRTE